MYGTEVKQILIRFTMLLESAGTPLKLVDKPQS